MPKPIVIVGAGPAGLMAAEAAVATLDGTHPVIVFDQMPSPARKFLMAGRGGLNLTHSEPLDRFLTRYPSAPTHIKRAVRAFTPDALVAWANALGAETFVGSSGRIFPSALKASPLLRSWLVRLGKSGIELRPRHRWTGVLQTTNHSERAASIEFETSGGNEKIEAAAIILAVGGASWPRLGSDGRWLSRLHQQGVPATSFAPSNCGIHIDWTGHFKERFAGQPLKRIAVTLDGATVRGELMVTETGFEGGAIYALSNQIRTALCRQPKPLEANAPGTDTAASTASITIDLRPDLDVTTLETRLARPRNRQSLSNHLRKTAGLSLAAIGLLREVATSEILSNPPTAAKLIKNVPLEVTGLAGLERAISSVGGIAHHAITETGMLKSHPGVFVAGEMLDWDAPTGGYLLQACFATGQLAGREAASWAMADSVSGTGR